MKTKKEITDEFLESQVLKHIRYANRRGKGFKPFKMSPSAWLALERLIKNKSVYYRSVGTIEEFQGYWTNEC